MHRSEISELIFRTVLENFNVASWLLKRKNITLHKRFRDYSTGREILFGEKILKQAADEEMKEQALKIIDKAIKEAGVRHIDVATERGDIFDLRIDQMADEVWGKDNIYYFLYKRTSEVTHGHWRVIAKYHLAKSLNPMQNGLYRYNEHQNRFAGLFPAFISLSISTDMLLTILRDIESEEVNELKTKLNTLRKKTWDGWMKYYNKYILKSEGKQNDEKDEH